MNFSTTLQSLQEFKQFERIAERYYLKHQKELSYSQYFYLRKRSFPTNSLELLDTSKAIAEVKDFETHFLARYNGKELTESDFLSPNCNIEIEQLMRYIHVPMHAHDFMEISCVLSGRCTHIIDGRTYQQSTGSITYIPSHVTHELYASPDCVCITMKIRRSIFENFDIPNLPYFSVPVCFYTGNDSFIINTVLSMYTQQEEQLAYCNTVIEHLFQVLTIYCMQKYQDTMTLLVVDTSTRRLNLEIITYIFENYQTVTLRSLSKHLHYSEAYLSRLIHQQTGETFSTVIRNYRLSKAATLLVETNLKLDEVCDAVGYKDPTQFIRNFKSRYGVTPAKYRKASKTRTSS